MSENLDTNEGLKSLNIMHVCGAIDAPQHKGDAGYDIHCPEHVVIGAQQAAWIETDVHVELPPGVSALVIGRGGRNKQGLICLVGLIDNGFRGGICVSLFNTTDRQIALVAGERVAQLVLFHAVTPLLARVDSPSELTPTERGEQGFGSTGS